MKLREYSLFLIFIGASCAISLRALLLANVGLMEHQEVMATLSGINQKLDWCGQCSEVRPVECGPTECTGVGSGATEIIVRDNCFVYVAGDDVGYINVPCGEIQ